MTAAPRGGGRARRGALLLLFLASGAISLVYEVSWTRRLVLLVGSTATATALLLAAYMLGLALGARLGGPVADRARRPLRLYAVLEAGAAVLALAVPWLLDGILRLDSLTAAGREPLLFGAAFALLLLPTALLGATLPALARAVVEDPGLVGPRVGALYAANTAGAVAGALAAGFALVEWLGVDGSARAAAAASFVVAGVAWLLSGREGPEGAGGAGEDPAEEGAPEPGSVGPPGPAPGVLPVAMAAAFAGGFVGLAAEVAWTRLLVFTMQGFTAAFSAMLGAFLLGSALGSAAFGRLAGGTRRPLALLGWIQVGAGVVAAGTLLALSSHYDLLQWIRGALPSLGSPRANHDARLLASAFAVLGPPAFLMGGVFPVAARAVAGGLGDLGSRLGRLYAANTLGAVLGSLAAGFLLVPLLGARGAGAAVAVLSLLAGIATLAVSARREGAGPRLRPLLVAGASAAVLLLCGAAAPGEPMILRSHVFLGPRGRENRLIASREGRAGLASVVQNVRNDFTSLYTDEFLAASTEGRYRYMRMLGHIPVVLAEDPRRVLVMAFGTGTTAGSLSTHPTVDRLDVVEISREVLDLAPHFASVNRGVLDRAGKPGRPEVRVFVEDARRFVLSSRDLYDVITLEPLLPCTPGAVHLYTREFYELCRARLAPGGAMCQWFPIHSMSSDDFRMLAASFVETFPESSLWFVEETAALVGTAGPQGIPVKRSAERLSAAGPREDLEAGRLDDLAQWWSFRVCGGAALREWTRGVRAMTDEHPDIEFHPEAAVAITTYFHDNLVTVLDLREKERIEDAADLSGLGEGEAASFRARLAAASAATAACIDGRASEDKYGYYSSLDRLAGSPGEDDEAKRFAALSLQDALRRYADAVRAHPRDRIAADRWRNAETVRLLNEGRVLLRRGRAGESADAYQRAIDAGSPWNRDEAWTGLGRALLAEGRPAAAREALAKAVEIYPGNRDAQALTGQALVALGSPWQAREWFERAYEGGSGPADEDAALRDARAAAEQASARSEPPSPSGGPGDRGIRAVLSEALDDAADAPGKRRDRAVARLRGASGEEKAVLADLLEPRRKAALDGSQPAAERVRALSVLAAAADPGIGATALKVARGAGGDAALALAAVDAAGEGGGAEALSPFTTTASGLPPGVRSRALDRLAAIRDPRSVDGALGALDDPALDVRYAAMATLFQLTGRKGFDPGAMEEERRAAAAALRAWWAGARTSWK